MSITSWIKHLIDPILRPGFIIGKKTDISSEYEDLSNEIEICGRYEPWYLHPY